MGDELETIVQKMIDAGESEDNIAAVIREFKAESPASTEAQVGTGGGGLALGAARAAAPGFLKGVEQVATNPAVPKATGALARTATTLGGIGHGLYTGNLSEIVAAPIAGWQAGKGGYWLGKGMQSLAGPVANAANAVAPYAQAAAGPLNIAAGAGELAQMAEPNRQDIGFLGIGASQPRSAAEQEAHPALLNFLISKLMGK